MKIATLQFDCKPGDAEGNIQHADSLLESADLQDVQLLVGPELAMTGYNFPSLEAISAYLEPTCGGATAWWAARTARRYNLVVSIGYPELTLNPDAIPEEIPYGPESSLEEVIKQSQGEVERIRSSSGIEFWTFNSTLTVAPDGKILAHYRKTHLYYTDASWSLPSLEGFITREIHFPRQSESLATSFAICMDLNPKAFTADYTAYEVASHTISTNAQLLVISTAWMTLESAASKNDDSPCCKAEEAYTPNMDTLEYWMGRLFPLCKAKEKTIVVIANRIGAEAGAVESCDLDNLVRPVFKDRVFENKIEKQETTKNLTAVAAVSSLPGVRATDVSASAHYSGTSAIMTFGDGKIIIHGLSSRGRDDVLVADSEDKAIMMFRVREDDVD